MAEDTVQARVDHKLGPDVVAAFSTFQLEPRDLAKARGELVKVVINLVKDVARLQVKGNRRETLIDNELQSVFERMNAIEARLSALEAK